MIVNEANEMRHPGKPSILVVDDHDGLRRLLRSWLGDVFPGDRVMDVASGEEAVALAASQPPDIILMDIQLLEMSGIEATRRIKAIAPQTRVVILTSLGGTAARLAASVAGASAYVEKHLIRTDLIPVIEALHASFDAGFPPPPPPVPGADPQPQGAPG